MNEDLIPFELAKKLKEKGYPQQCGDDAYILEDEYEEFEVGSLEFIPLIPEHLQTVVAPTISQVLKWLRKEKDIDIVIEPIDRNTIFMSGERYILSIYIDTKRYYKIHHDKIDKFIEWEDAALTGIEYILDNLI